jgi:hypothetical protein
VTGNSIYYKSPFSDTISPYVAVETGFAAYTSAKLGNQLSLVWGTPDKFNKILFFDGTSLVGSITGSSIGLGNGRGAYFATLKSSVAFNKVELVSPSASFEFSNVSISAVPLPASFPMLGGALLALAGFGYGLNRWVAPKDKAAA